MIIETEAEYVAAVAEMNAIFDKGSDRLDDLIEAIETYANIHYPIPKPTDEEMELLVPIVRGQQTTLEGSLYDAAKAKLKEIENADPIDIAAIERLADAIEAYEDQFLEAYMKHVYIWTDGSCLGNPGPGGWAALLRYEGHEKVVSGSTFDTTSPEMEVTAILGGLQAVKTMDDVDVWVASDSTTAIGWVFKGYKRKAAHICPILEQIDREIARLGGRVKYWKVEGHVNEQNQTVDRIARSLATKQRNSDNVNGLGIIRPVRLDLICVCAKG